MIKKRVSEFISGLMEESMKECGAMANSMERESFTMRKAKVREVYGKMENV
jgi:hypothetical protein